MCGIAGAVDLTGENRPFSRGRLRAMTGAIAHRGPDDEHFFADPGLALGARRLSIVDLAGGRQPISNETGSVWVAFNGELFEYPELREQLLARGHHLATRCDTEAWVHLYEDFGAGMFDHARGQFAVSLWDAAERRLFLGRDRMGICPLFYAQAEGWLLWASEVRSLLASGLVEAKPDVRGLNHFFSFFCTGTSRTCFEGVHSLPPGHYLEIHDGRIEQRKYWDLDFPDRGDERRTDRPEQLVDELDAALRTATRRRLRGDVPVVSYLSGGLDSSVVLALASDERGEPVPAFSIGLDKAGPDERDDAVQSAAAVQSPLRMVTMNRAAIARDYPELILAAEAPVLDTSCACLLRLASTVHDSGYKVVLTGEGADEGLAGYFWFKSQMLRERYVKPWGPWLGKTIRSSMLSLLSGGSRHRPPQYATHGVRTAQQDTYEFVAQSREVFFNEDLWQRLDGHSAYDDLDLTNDRMPRWHPLNQSLYMGYRVHLPGLLLSAKGDRIAMHSSVEARYPFLDDDVIALCAAIDPQYKLRGMTDKWLLRQVAARRLPAPIAKRKKTMFRATLSNTFVGANHPAWADDLLSPAALAATGLFDPERVAAARKIVTRPQLTPNSKMLDFGLTQVVATQLWHHTFCGGGLTDLPVWSAPALAEVDEPLSTTV